MKYLADAQSRGLEGLWQKLCDGLLPARCSKQWFFETFCGIDRQAFDEAHYELLDGSANIAAHLNGCAPRVRTPACPRARRLCRLRLTFSLRRQSRPNLCAPPRQTAAAL